MMERLTWRIMLWATRRWATRYMDQWTKYRLRTEFGPVYVGLERATPWPESFDDYQE
jgi:hypothetical protein